MCRISYEKCVCFVFLVILAVLSCSGFRIDNLAMTDISKRNSHLTSISSFMNTDRLFGGHRVRHHRQLRAHQAHTRNFESQRPHQGRIDTHIVPHQGTDIPTTLSDEPFAQLSPTDTQPFIPTKSASRFQRSNNNGRKRNQPCQDLSVWNKVYAANTVVVADTESTSMDGKTKHFKVVEILKNTKDSTFPLMDDQVKISDSYGYRLNTKYILFLDRNGPHNYTVVDRSERASKKLIATISKFKFRTRPVKVEKLERDPTKRRLKLICKVKGLPIPCITWTHNGIKLQSNKRVRITYKKRKSTLVIRNITDGDWGSYTCSAQGPSSLGHNAYSSEQILVEMERRYATRKPSENPENGTDCIIKFKEAYCLNGGTCFYEDEMNEYGCRCAPGFNGKRCELKTSHQPSRYPQTHLSTCKVGLYTKYDNC